MPCEFCNETLYIKITKYLKSIAAPLTPAEALRQQLEDLTGETYVRVEHNFCPMCGEKIRNKGGAKL